MKQSIFLFSIILLLLSCSKEKIAQYETVYPAEIYFVDKDGNDISHRIPMQQSDQWYTWEGGLPIHPQDQYQHYVIPKEEYNYECYVNGKYIDKISKTEIVTPRVWLEITTTPSDKRKRFTFALSLFDQINYKDAYSGHVYEFEYYFSIPALFGEQENVLKIRSEACKFWNRDFESATFNGKPITPTGNRTFEITVD